jgi:hypothetical protein
VTRRSSSEVAPDINHALPVKRPDGRAWWATLAGLTLALVGFVDGLVMLLNKKVVTCPDGQYFPEGATDLSCYAHAQAGVGAEIAVISLMLGILIVFGSILVSALLRGELAIAGNPGR